MYISANAITKQINLLEDHLGVKLFVRSSQGLTLTEAGKLIYSEAKKLIHHSNLIVRKARELEKPKEYTIRIGVSLMNPASNLLERWAKASERFPNLRPELVPFEDSVPAFNDVLDHLGEKIDLISCPYQSTYWGDRYNAFHLWDLPLCITCAKTHPLARQEQLTLSDLHGETLICTNPGIKPPLDPLRAEIERDHPQITLKGVDYIDTGTFNQLASSSELLLSAECWSGVHPLLATTPLECGYTLPYGLIYAKDPPQEVLQFIMAVGQPDKA
ncbi:MAG: LysR family transcriptional regulator [Lawsonibacter sp.]|nr:LysR family transcriptional regulator [Lawsonibacter sp.]